MSPEDLSRRVLDGFALAAADGNIAYYGYMDAADVRGLAEAVPELRARLSAAEQDRDNVLLSVTAALAQRDREVAAAEARAEAAEEALLRRDVELYILRMKASDEATEACADFIADYGMKPALLDGNGVDAFIRAALAGREEGQ